MGLLANFKIRTKVLIASLPLVVMIIVAAMYASVGMNNIDRRYSDLIGRDVKALHNLTVARVMNNRYGQLLYEEIAEPDPVRMRALDADLDETVQEFHSAVADARTETPGLTSKINAVTVLFDQAVSDSRPVRAAAMINDNTKAITLTREAFDPVLHKGRQALIDLADELHATVDERSAELSATGRTVRF